MDEEFRITPVDQCDYRKAMADYAEEIRGSLGPSHDAPHLWGALTQISGDASARGLLTLARLLDTTIPVADYEVSPTGLEPDYPWEDHLLIRSKRSGEEYLFAISVEPELSHDGKRLFEDFRRTRLAATMDIEDPMDREQARRMIVVDMMFRPTDDESTAQKDQSNYLPAKDTYGTKEVSIIPIPAHADRESIIKNGIGGQKPSPPPDLKIVLNRSFDAKRPGMNSWCSGPSALQLLGTLHSACLKADFSDIIARDAASLGPHGYLHYGEKDARCLAEAAAAAVYEDQGTIGASVTELIEAHWQLSTAIEMNLKGPQAVAVAEMLEGGGHVSPESEYDCNDLDDFGYVTTKDDGSLFLTLRDQNANYEVLIENPNHEHPAITILASDRDSPSHPTELARFGWDAANETYTMSAAGTPTTKVLRRLNGAIDLVNSMHCCLEEDYASSPQP